MPAAAVSSVDPVAVYLDACHRHGVKRANPRLLALFRAHQDRADEIEELDLEGNYIGNRGIHAVLDVIERLPNFRYLNLSNQKLYNTDLSEASIKGNATVDRLVDVLSQHPAANAVDLSGNPVSNYAGRKLLTLVQGNHRLCRVGLTDTRVDFDLRKRISAQCERNTIALWESADGVNGGADSNDTKGFGDTFGWTPPAAAADLTCLGAGRNRRETVRCEGIDPEKVRAFVAPSFPKTEGETRLIVDMLTRNVLFSFLTSKDLLKVAGAMQQRIFSLGDEVMTQSMHNDTLYIIQEGEADILKEGQKVFVKKTGTAFGEIELMYDTPCAATVKVTSPRMVTWALDRETYRNLVLGTAISRREMYMKHLDRIPLLASLDNYEKLQVADALSTEEFQPGEYLLRIGCEGEWMHIILEGTVEVIGREGEAGEGEERFVCEFTTGDCVGELEFINNHRTVADVRAKTYVQTAKLNRRHFEMCMGPIIELLVRNAEGPKFDYYHNAVSKAIPDTHQEGPQEKKEEEEL